MEYNIGSEKQPQMIKLSKLLSDDERRKYLALLKEYKDIFAWSYQDLKTYDTIII